MVNEFDKELANCNSDSTVLGDLALLDQSGSSGEKAWTNEDPTIEETRIWLQDHPFKDKDGKEVPLDGPAVRNIGLEWTSDPVKANHDNVTVTVKGENKTEKAREFKKLSFRFFVPKRETALFEGSRFAKKGRGDSTDGQVEFVTSEAVTNVGEDMPTRFDERQSEVTVVALPADTSKPILLPSGATVKFQISGRTGGVGTSAGLVTEAYYFPEESTYHDVIIKKE
ncbi:hypothetical protein IL306_014355 [Fusarium sp. DS 682]|nr:hypothetical protein IL306_014355 [Fusarium sp. DS 682]